jgi:hypothetical protein
MKPHHIWFAHIVCTVVGLAVLVSCPGSASAFEVAFSGVVERSSTNSRIEVFATLTLPLDEWVQVTPEVVRWVSADPTYASAWDRAERGEDLAAAAEGTELQWLIEPPWADSSGSEPYPSGFAGVLMEPGKDGEQASQAPPSPVRVTKVAPPKLDRLFLEALMAACSSEFRDARSHLDDLASRARLSAWLPELQLKGGRNTDQTLRLTPTETEPDRYQAVGGDGVRYEGQVRWTFSQLVFARDELAVARLRGALDVERRKRQQQAIEALSKWLAAWTILASTGVEETQLLEAWVSESALRAELDWLSQGWFGTHVPAAPEWADVPAQ